MQLPVCVAPTSCSSRQCAPASQVGPAAAAARDTPPPPTTAHFHALCTHQQRAHLPADRLATSGAPKQAPHMLSLASLLLRVGGPLFLISYFYFPLDTQTLAPQTTIRPSVSLSFIYFIAPPFASGWAAEWQPTGGVALVSNGNRWAWSPFPQAPPEDAPAGL